MNEVATFWRAPQARVRARRSTRTCGTLVALFAVATTMATQQAPAERTFVYAAIGPELRVYELDVARATLSQRGSVTLPADIQAGNAHATGGIVSVAWSDGTNVSAGSRHGLSTLRIDPTSGVLTAVGTPVPLPSRPIYVSTDAVVRHLLVAYTAPSGITVHPIAPDGGAAPAMAQQPLKLGIYGHQAVVDPSGTTAILVGRGNYLAAGRPEDPGELDVLDYRDGRLSNRMAIAPNQGIGFHPRNAAFHPTRPWLFVSLSQQNALGVYEKRANGLLNAERLYEKSSLVDPANVRPGQLTGVLHMHPTGRFVYIANRATSTVKVDGKPVFAGGENSIAVFGIDPRSGEPTLIQNAETQGMGPVEFALDPSGRVLVVANMFQMWVDRQGSLVSVPPSIAIFRVRDDGKLEFVRKYDIESDGRTLFWLGAGSAKKRG